MRYVWPIDQGTWLIKHKIAGYLGLQYGWCKQILQSRSYECKEDAEYIAEGLVARKTVLQGYSCVDSNHLSLLEVVQVKNGRVS